MPPQYFLLKMPMNKMGYANVDEVIAKGTQASPAAFEAASNEENALVLDVRVAKDFAAGLFTINNIGLEGQFVSCGQVHLITDLQITYFVDYRGRKRGGGRVAFVGLQVMTIVQIHLKGGFEAWPPTVVRQIMVAATISAEDFVDKFSKDNTHKAIDVCRKSEYDL